MSEKPNLIYNTGAVADVLADLLERACEIVPRPKPAPKPDEKQKK